MIVPHHHDHGNNVDYQVIIEDIFKIVCALIKYSLLILVASFIIYSISQTKKIVSNNPGANFWFVLGKNLPYYFKQVLRSIPFGSRILSIFTVSIDEKDKSFMIFVTVFITTFIFLFMYCK